MTAWIVECVICSKKINSDDAVFFLASREVKYCMPCFQSRFFYSTPDRDTEGDENEVDKNR